MRFNRSHAVATDLEGRAVASWLDDSTELYQRPQNPSNPEGPWLMVTRSGGDTQPFNPQGANQWFARDGQWVRRLDGASPQLIGSATWLSNYPNAYAGDVDYDGTILILSPDKLTMIAGDVSVRRSDVQGDTRLIMGLLCYTSLGVVKVYDLWNGAWLETEQVGPGASWAMAWRDALGTVWLSYQTDAHGGVIHRISDASVGYKYGTPEQIYFPEVDFHGAGGRMGWSYNAGQFPRDWRFSPVIATWGENMVPLELPPVPVEPPIMATGPFEPEGTPIDVSALFAHNDQFWPRGDKSRGDDHGMDMQMLSSGDIWYAKFDDDGQGKLGEVLRVEGEYVHLRMDASNLATVDVWPGDSRWLRTSMKIGRQYGLSTGIHQLEKRKRSDCSLVRPSQDFQKENWIISRQMMFCGSDLGECRVTRYAYNNTGWKEGQTGSPDLWVETYYMGEQWRVDTWVSVGWLGWTADPSSVVFKTGTAIWPAVSALTKWFARLGGKRYPPSVPSCMPPVAFPPEVPVSVPMPDACVALLKRYALVYPPPWGPPGAQQDQDCRDWCYRFAQQAHYSLGPTFGAKSTSPGGQTSKDVMAMRDSSGLNGWDVLTAAGGGSPTLNIPPGWVDLTGQAFVPVQPINHLGRVLSSPRLSPPSPWVGLTSFDLSPRVAAGDMRWIDMLVREGIKNPRVFVVRKSWANSTTVGLAQLPDTLIALASAGLKAEITMLADTALYGMTEGEALAFVRSCVSAMVANPGGVGLVQGANEPEHSTQQPYVRWASFQAAVAALVPSQFAFTFGPSTHGGGGAWVNVLTTHGARNQTPDQNAVISAQLVIDGSWRVHKDEPLGVGPVNIPGSRTNDPAFGAQLAQAIKAHGLAGGTLHIQAGLSCDVDAISASEWGAIRGFVAGMGGAPSPGPTPHKILDAPLSPGLPTGYVFWVNNWTELAAEADAWYQRAYGRRPAQSDIGHGLWRAIYEGDRWKTARNAFANTWPGGEP